MYFTYTVPRNYQRTLTQGVTLGDRRKPMLDYRRRTIQAVRLETWNGRFANLFYRTTQGVGVKTWNGNIANYVKRVENTANGNDNKHIAMFALRLLTATIKTTETIFNKTVFLRVLAECSNILSSYIGLDLHTKVNGAYTGTYKHTAQAIRCRKNHFKNTAAWFTARAFVQTKKRNCFKIKNHCRNYN